MQFCRKQSWHSVCVKNLFIKTPQWQEEKTRNSF